MRAISSCAAGTPELQLLHGRLSRVHDGVARAHVHKAGADEPPAARLDRRLDGKARGRRTWQEEHLA